MAKNKRKQGDGTVRLRSDGRWEGRVVVGHKENGNPITKNILAKTKFECEEKLKKLKEECGRFSERIKPDMPFGDWIDFWYQNFCKPALRETTKACYENFIYKHVIPSIGSIPLISLTQNNLQQFYAKLKKEGRITRIELYGTELSNRMVRSCHACCRAALAKAVAEGLITRNPAIDCKLPPKKGHEVQVLTNSELGRFLARAKEEGYYEFFLLELSTGMRRGEILALKWSDLDLTTRSLHISRQVIPTAKQKTEKYLVEPPKTKSSVRTILLPPYMVELLAVRKKQKTCDWIFPSPTKEGEPLNPGSIPSLFHRILKRAGCKHLRFHDLRHTFATMALENGMDVKTLSAMIGHVSAETTLNIYSHVTDTMRAQAAARIDRKIGGTDTPIPEPSTKPQKQETHEIEPPVAPYTPKIRKSGTGCIYQVNESLWEGSFSPRLPNGKRHKYNTYAKTREECEKQLAEMILRIKAEIKTEKEKRKAELSA